MLFFAAVHRKKLWRRLRRRNPLLPHFISFPQMNTYWQWDVWASLLEDVCIRGCLRTCVYTILRPLRRVCTNTSVRISLLSVARCSGWNIPWPHYVGTIIIIIIIPETWNGRQGVGTHSVRATNMRMTPLCPHMACSSPIRVTHRGMQGGRPYHAG